MGLEEIRDGGAPRFVGTTGGLQVGAEREGGQGGKLLRDSGKGWEEFLIGRIVISRENGGGVDGGGGQGGIVESWERGGESGSVVGGFVGELGLRIDEEGAVGDDAVAFRESRENFHEAIATATEGEPVLFVPALAAVHVGDGTEAAIQHGGAGGGEDGGGLHEYAALGEHAVEERVGFAGAVDVRIGQDDADLGGAGHLIEVGIELAAVAEQFNHDLLPYTRACRNRLVDRSGPLVPPIRVLFA